MVSDRAFIFHIFIFHIPWGKRLSLELKSKSSIKVTVFRQKNDRCGDIRVTQTHLVFHFILVCKAFEALRVKRIQKYYRKRPSMFKIINFLNTKKISDLVSSGKFVLDATKL